MEAGLIILVTYIVLAGYVLSKIPKDALRRPYNEEDKNCPPHKWAWEEKVKEPGRFMIICTLCRQTPSLGEHDQ